MRIAARVVLGLLLNAVATKAWNIAPGVSSISCFIRSLGTKAALPLARGRCGLSRGMIRMAIGEGQAKLRPVILCPAQFGTSDDYHKLKADLKDRGFDLYPAPLRRFDWVRPVPCPNIYCVALQCGGAHALFMGTCKQRQCSKSALL